MTSGLKLNPYTPYDQAFITSGLHFKAYYIRIIAYYIWSEVYNFIPWGIKFIILKLITSRLKLVTVILKLFNKQYHNI